ncbi:MAG: alanine racemase [Oscillospiraceae bacterium]|nr:alanine racemase [Oscillospiraceae bacterium]
MLTLCCDAAALRHNARYIRAAAGGRLIAVVKHDAYGAGLAAAVRALENEVYAFAAAEPEEALRARALSPGSRVMTLAPVCRSELSPCLSDIILSVGSVDIIPALAGIYINMSGAAALRVDIGGSGIGLPPGDFPKALAALENAPNIRLAAVFAHCPSLYTADGGETARRFAPIAAAAKRFDARCVCHLATSASWRAPGLRFDAVRVGTNLYGLPSGEAQDIAPLRPVLSLSAPVRAVFDVRAPLCAYDGCVALPGVTRAGLVGAGYGHLPALLHAKGARVLVRGQFARVLGSACMSHLLVDLTDIPQAAPGDEAILVGGSGNAQITAREFARCCGIPVCRCEGSLFAGSCTRRVCAQEEGPV